MLFVSPRAEVLMLLRDDKPGIPYPGTWDLPGGHLEPGETPHDCMVREMQEELPGLPLGDIRRYDVCEFPDRIDHLFWTQIDARESDLNQILREGQRVAWMTRAQIREIDVAFGFGPVLEHFFERLDGGLLV